MSVALDRFRKLPLPEQQGYVSRVKGGLVDEPPEFAAMQQLVNEQENKLRSNQLPGGTTLGEQLDYEARIRAGLVDRPGERFERRMDPPDNQPDVFSPPHSPTHGYVKPYPWGRT